MYLCSVLYTCAPIRPPPSLHLPTYLPTDKPFSSSSHHLKQYLIMLDNPDLMDPISHGMATSLFTALVKLSDQGKDAIRDYIASQADSERFTRWLSAIQQYVSIR